MGRPRELYERPSARFVADFIGTNHMVEGTVRAVESEAQRIFVETALGELRALLNGRLQAGERCLLCIRPENAAVNNHVEGDSNILAGKVTFSSYLGNTLRYDV